MNIQITSRKFKAKDSLKDFIFAEVGSLDKYHDGITDAEVVLTYENTNNNIKIAEIILPIPGKTLTAKESTDDFKKSIAAVVMKIEKQLDKIKSKTIDTKRSANKLTDAVEIEQSEDLDDEV